MSAGIATAGRELRYGIRGTEHTMTVSTPVARPDLWESYVAGALEVYSSHGVAPALELDPDLTSLMFVAHDRHGRVRGGMRSQGPLDHPAEAQALAVWENDATLRRWLRARLADGLVESKGLWVAPGFEGRRDVVNAFGRAPVYASTILGARHGIGSAARHSERLWTSSGAIVEDGIPAVPYPDDRYLTRLVSWDRWNLPAGISDDVRRAMDLETAQLLGVDVPLPRVGR
ncbi:hypothetical protein [Actinomycetospora chiangmaiensis]|uniref:hypothetical protein n=1 Tax=Actinomycetospora chiangmaiensis TaxID=402650 RepID=UPI0012F9CFA6|nr:hypothetical protein [Actinomycetospora chiangmaiensis]